MVYVYIYIGIIRLLSGCAVPKGFFCNEFEKLPGKDEEFVVGLPEAQKYSESWPWMSS